MLYKIINSINKFLNTWSLAFSFLKERLSYQSCLRSFYFYFLLLFFFYNICLIAAVEAKQTTVALIFPLIYNNYLTEIIKKTRSDLMVTKSLCKSLTIRTRFYETRTYRTWNVENYIAILIAPKEILITSKLVCA